MPSGLNPFQPSVVLSYPLKTSENLYVFWCFQGYINATLGWNGLILFCLLCTNCLTNTNIHIISLLLLTSKGKGSISIYFNEIYVHNCNYILFGGSLCFKFELCLFCFTRVCLGPEIKTERLKKFVEYFISQESFKVWIFKL